MTIDLLAWLTLTRIIVERWQQWISTTAILRRLTFNYETSFRRLSDLVSVPVALSPLAISAIATVAAATAAGRAVVSVTFAATVTVAARTPATPGSSPLLTAGISFSTQTPLAFSILNDSSFNINH
mmetsp:Transcript_36132/g.71031  ORF Transcript_36132/g.71031 Transcript_36132/m.71031 type:complete len:126 (-) Transcript_36132:9-386(-)